MTFSPVVVIPVYNHPATIGFMVDEVLKYRLPCILVDDGSDAHCAAVLDALAACHAGRVVLLRLPANQGKGGAMMAGFREATRLGHSHALQIDADGQHDTSDIPRFIDLARGQPEAVICGCPRFDESVPRIRLYGRYVTHILVWLQTLSFEIRDSMCGFRLYPLAATLALMNSVRLGKRMEFDTEVLVRLVWSGVRVVNVLTPVHYPRDGVSHFRFLHDNLWIARMHFRLVAGMLPRAPLLVWRKLTRAKA